jgi:2-oxoglutarate dehydrogenase E1 component
LDKNFDTAKQKESLDIKLFLEEDWESFPYPTNQLLNKPIDTSFDKKRLLELADTLTTLPNKLDFYKKPQKL